MAANTLTFLLLITEFPDTETAPGIKPPSQNKGNNIDTKYWFNGQDLRYILISLL